MLVVRPSTRKLQLERAARAHNYAAYCSKQPAASPSIHMLQYPVSICFRAESAPNEKEHFPSQPVKKTASKGWIPLPCKWRTVGMMCTPTNGDVPRAHELLYFVALVTLASFLVEVAASWETWFRSFMEADFSALLVALATFLAAAALTAAFLLFVSASLLWSPSFASFSTFCSASACWNIFSKLAGISGFLDDFWLLPSSPARPGMDRCSSAACCASFNRFSGTGDRFFSANPSARARASATFK
mmetsp:Transcript_76124/g.111517  ORF Transcript_76124/g.111517 Transcript_76124/m.111517 type:complete len:245 (-) Transcript_76124:295-1029(-)